MQKAFFTAGLVVSIHDVSPLTCVQTQKILTDLSQIGLGVTSLLVIPDHHRSGLISKNPDFRTWIQSKVNEGHEPVLHGYYHLREKSAGDGLGKRLVTESYTAGEGEFYDISREKASHRLQAGLKAFEECGLKTTGFIAPAWLLGEEAEEAVRSAGFQYTTRIGSVSDYSTSKVHEARSLVWSVRAGWRRWCSLAWNAALFGALRNAPLLRIGIHPPDWEHSRIRSQILRLTRSALAARHGMTYQQWLNAGKNQP